jgi:UDP-N-acetylglucosamine 2-epimerase (non-hydrolysing)
MSILIVYGTRPEYIKIKPLMKAMRNHGIPYKTLFTGQHENIAPDNANFIWKMVDYEGNRLNSVLKNCLSIPDYVFDNFEYVIVQGDTTSVLGIALACMNRQIKVIHLEAGLRTYDKLNPYPEEYNRELVSRIADIHLCPTEQAKQNLDNEGIWENVHVVGNTVLDNLLEYKKDCEYGNRVLVTLHRRENHRDMGYWFTEINELAGEHPELEFIIPLHPNPKVQIHKNILTNLTVVEPMEHDKLVQLLVKCRLVITDSGGLQEECSFFNKICLVCRETTERPEALGHSSILVPDYSLLNERFKYHITRYNLDDVFCPFGDGMASEYICDIIKK